MSTCQSCGGVIGRDCFNPIECMMITQAMIADDAVKRALRCAADERVEKEHNDFLEGQYGEHLRDEYYEHIGFDPIAMGM